MYSGIPILIYDNLKKYGFKSKPLKLLLELKKNNIIHNNPEECAAFINKHYDNIDDWWCDKKTKKAIKYILKHPELFSEGERLYVERVKQERKQLKSKPKDESSQTNLSNT